ncbi:STAS domain-containing protein [Micromonospora sp. WMMD1155]|uniref:STAS domain-containing protein n=1 Tax=Micromonospora sp. WMMD1155 TaxID=3016094 RepID=UPI00249CD2A2|nr:STAS domain-containing protein [Micromonospora sp. WMMD1155]WFE53214.1 STAS domain-containing protein [Micromonospora sp. WMMD1155]
MGVSELNRDCLPAAGAVFDRVLALQPRRIVIDLSQCRHIDAAAIGLLLEVHRRLARADGILAVRDPNPRIARILRDARLDRVLQLVSSPPSCGSVPPAEGHRSDSAQPTLVAHGRASVHSPHWTD